MLFCLDAATGAIQTVRASTGGAVDFLSTGGGEHIAKFNGDGDALVLVGRNSSQWVVVSNISAVAFSTV